MRESGPHEYRQWTDEQIRRRRKNLGLDPDWYLGYVRADELEDDPQATIESLLRRIDDLERFVHWLAEKDERYQLSVWYRKRPHP